MHGVEAVQRSNTVPIEKGTETEAASAVGSGTTRRSNTVPIEKGTETVIEPWMQDEFSLEATPSPSRRGLKQEEGPVLLVEIEKQHRPHREGD